jgi:hypothetical protein
MAPSPSIIPTVIFKRIEDLIRDGKEKEAKCIAGEWKVQIKINHFGAQTTVELRRDFHTDPKHENFIDIDDFIKKISDGHFFGRPWPQGLGPVSDDEDENEDFSEI